MKNTKKQLIWLVLMMVLSGVPFILISCGDEGNGDEVNMPPENKQPILIGSVHSAPIGFRMGDRLYPEDQVVIISDGYGYVVVGEKREEISSFAGKKIHVLEAEIEKIEIDRSEYFRNLYPQYTVNIIDYLILDETKNIEKQILRGTVVIERLGLPQAEVILLETVQPKPPFILEVIQPNIPYILHELSVDKLQDLQQRTIEATGYIQPILSRTKCENAFHLLEYEVVEERKLPSEAKDFEISAEGFFGAVAGHPPEPKPFPIYTHFDVQITNKSDKTQVCDILRAEADVFRTADESFAYFVKLIVPKEEMKSVKIAPNTTEKLSLFSKWYYPVENIPEGVSLFGEVWLVFRCQGGEKRFLIRSSSFPMSYEN